MPAVAVHHTATSGATWDGGAAEKDLGTDYTLADLKDVFAWVPDGTAPNKADCVFPHHFVTGGKPGDASTIACTATVGILNGAHGGSNIPAGDHKGVYNHVIAHLRDAGIKEADLPELKASGLPLVRRGLVLPRTALRERRSQMDDAWRGRMQRRATPIGRAQAEMRANPDSASGPSFRFQGHAAVFETPFDMWDMWGDPYTEILSAGSCTRTLNSRPDVPFLIGHNDSGIALARTARAGRPGTMNLSADSYGLGVDIPQLDGRSPLVQSLASAMDRGDMDEMSFAFMVNQQEWSPDFMTRRIAEVDIHRGDVSIVCLAANPATAGASMTALPVSEAAARQAGLREVRTPTAPYSVKPGEDSECPQCHSMNDADAAYCDQCGTAVRPTGASTAQENETQRCPCGAWNADDAKFCSSCGTNIASDLDADNGGTGNGSTTAPSPYLDWTQRRPGAQRRGEPDFSAKPPQDLSAHGDGSLMCPNDECQAPNAQDAGYCDQCGQPLYDEGGLIESGGSVDDVVSDSSGLIEEEDMTLAAARLLMIKLKAGVR